MRLILLILLTLGAATPLHAQPVTLATSARLGVEIRAGSRDWCADQPTLTVTAPDPSAYATPDFADIVQRLGTALVASQCPTARAIALNGTSRTTGAGTVWSGSATAANNWVLQPAAPPPVDLDAVRPPAPVARAAPPTPPPAAPAPVAPPPSAVVQTLDAAGRAQAELILRPTFGRYDARQHCWAVSLNMDGSTNVGCMRIAVAVLVATADGAQVHILLNARGAQDCHACSGIAAFAAIDASGPTWRVTARPVPVRSGEYGAPNDVRNFAFYRLGADRWGWIEKSSSVAQGQVEGAFIVHLQRGPFVIEAGSLPGDSSNTGACDPHSSVSAPGCEFTYALTRSLTVDASNPALPAYPLILRTQGTKGRTRIDQQSTIPFNDITFHYVSPSETP